MGTPQSVVSRFENSANARLDTIVSYAQALDLELMVVPKRLASRVRAFLSGDAESNMPRPLIRHPGSASGTLRPASAPKAARAAAPEPRPDA
jgi:hypothetical protein